VATPRNLANSDIGARLKQLRRAQGWSQGDVAAQSGIARNTIYDLEAGKNPTLDTVERVAGALGYRAEITLTREEVPDAA
jgi:transcriptional regulator with XRE-family HTH domain